MKVIHDILTAVVLAHPSNSNTVSCHNKNSVYFSH